MSPRFKIMFALLMMIASSSVVAEDSKIDRIFKHIQEMAGQDSSSEEARSAREIVKELHPNYESNDNYNYHRNSSDDRVHRVEVQMKKKTEIEKRESLPEATTADIFK